MAKSLMAEAARGTKLSAADLTTGSDGGPASVPQGPAGGVKDVPLCSPGRVSAGKFAGKPDDSRRSGGACGV